MEKDTEMVMDSTEPKIDDTDKKLFTQKELEYHRAKWLADEKKKWQTSESTNFEKKSQKMVEDAINTWRTENGITDDVIEKLTKVEATVSEARKIKSESTKLSNEHQKTQERLSKVQTKLYDALTRDAVFNAASGKAVSPKHVWLDVKSRLRVDDESLKVFITDDNGERDDSLSIDDLVSKTLEENPFLAMPTGLPGSGNVAGYTRANGTKSPNLSERRPGDEADFLRDRLAPFLKQ